MKHKGGCHCNQFSFETDMHSMLIVQCNCKNCRCITGTIAIGCLYGETEIDFSGENNVYEFVGGSGFINKAHFSTKCHIRVFNRPAPEIMECMEVSQWAALKMQLTYHLM